MDMERSSVNPFTKTGLSQIEKPDDSFLILKEQELYNKIQSEVGSVLIEEKDRDPEGNLLAPNGTKSNLTEQEWKMTRTPSFLKTFGNWKDKYNKEQYNLWLKYQEMQTCQDYISRYQQDKENRRRAIPQNMDADYKKIELSIIEGTQEDIIRLSHKVSKLQAELINSGFNIHSDNLDYTKVLDENGEPLLLFRGTNFAPDQNTKFVVPKKEIFGKQFEVGVFFGKESEAKIHHENKNNKGKDSHLYKTFVNGRNFRIFGSKPNYWDNPNDSKKWQDKYDGLWVKKESEQNTHTKDEVNLMDYVCFDSNNILITEIK